MTDEGAQAVQGDMTEAEKRGNVIRLVFGGDPGRFDAFCEVVRKAVPPDTSVVLRGKWILENILGTPPPPPPPNVNTNLPQDAAEPKSSKQLMEQHRASPTCASW